MISFGGGYSEGGRGARNPRPAPQPNRRSERPRQSAVAEMSDVRAGLSSVGRSPSATQSGEATGEGSCDD